LTQHLLKAGCRVRALARTSEKGGDLQGRVEEIIVGDITDESALDRLAQGADAMLHLVSNFRTASGPRSSYYQSNVQGTRNALRAARKAYVRRFVHCSTIGVHGHVRSTPANEESPFNPGDLYQETKLEAELLVREEASTPGMETVIIRPCSIYGPGDMRMLKMFRMLDKNTFFLVGPCQENFHAVYIDDVVAGFSRALTVPDIHGETFIIGGARYLPLKDYIGAAAQAVGAPAPWLRFPYWLFYSAAIICEGLCVPIGVEPPLHRRRVRFYRNNRAFSIAKARKILGYEPAVDLSEGLRKTVEWYRTEGHLPPK
jgi:nucleoside-diphosphate-sugar epimerase